MEMLNQSISTPAQQQNNINGTDMISIGSYIKQQQRQQPSQMSGPHQRPSNGSNNFEQHAMIPATTGGDPANRVFNDQKSPINGHLHQNNSLSMPHQSMMEVQKNNQQSNVMMSYKVVNAGNSGRLPPLTLNSNNYSKNISVRLNNGAKDHNQSTFLNASIQSQPQMNHCEYNQTTITHNHVSSSLPMNEQLFDQQSGNSQQNMEASIRMNTPLPPHQHVDQQTQHVTYHEQNTHIQQQPDQTRYIRIADQNPNVSTQSMPMNQSQFQPALQTGNQMISSFQVNQTQEQVPHLSHMDQPPPTQHSMNSVPQSQSQQRLGQTGCNSNQLRVQNQSPDNVPSNISISSISSTSSGFSNNSAHKNSNNPMMSPTSIPMNANSTTQLLMAITNNSPITSEQLQEIQNMTSTAPDGTEMLLMQEPRLKQYGSLKDMSTTDLRLECKKRKLTSTGTKMRLCERMALYENEILDERNHQLMQEFTHRQQMYEAQSATLKAFQAKKALLQVQNSQTAGSVSNGGSTSGTAQSSSENSTLSHAMNNHNKTSEGPPAKKKRVSRPRKPAQPKVQKNAVKPQLIIPNASNQMSNLAPVSNDNNTPTDIDVLLGRSNSQPSMNFGNVGNNQNHQSGQNSAPVFGNGTSQTPGSTGFFMKDNSCFSHLGSGCRLISNSNDESQNSYGGTARAFQATVPPPPENAQIQLQQQNEQQMYNGPKQTVQQRMNSQPQQQQQQQSVAQSRPINLNQQQMISNPNQAMYTISTPTTMQQQQQQQQQQHMVHPNQTIYMNSTLAQQNGLQSSPCVADQAGPSPNMPIGDATATTSGSPVVISAVAETTENAEMMDNETMQKLLSPATLRAREELLTQQQAKINELVDLIQKNHNTLRDQQQQINLAKKQQKMRQQQNSQTAALEKHMNSRCIQHAMKNRANLQMLSELTKQQDSIRTAETRLIEQLHINTATDDIARLIKQDGRTALVIVSLLHDYRTTREQNNRVKTTKTESVADDKNAVVEVAAAPAPKKKAAPRKRPAAGTAKSNQSRRPSQKKSQPRPDVEIVQVIPPPTIEQKPIINKEIFHQKTQNFTEFSQPEVPRRPRTQSDVDMEEIFKTVIEASRSPQSQKNSDSQQQQSDNEVISLPSEVSSPIRTQSQNSAQSVFSDVSYTKNMMYQQDNSPQQYTMGAETESSCSPNEVLITPNELLQQQVQNINVIAQQVEKTDVLPQFEQSTLDQELGTHRYSESLMYNEVSNNDFCHNNGMDFDFPDIDQMVANFKDSEPLSSSLDDVDLTALLNCWTENCDSNQICGDQTADHDIIMYDPNNSAMGQHGMEWNNYSNHSNIINQAFEQSQMQ